MAFELPTLPYSKTALGAKGMCEETLDLHHGKHHQAYVTALNGFVEKDPSLQGKSLEEIVKPRTAGRRRRCSTMPGSTGTISCSGNHEPERRRNPGRAGNKITADLGGVAKFKDAFKAGGVGQFGSGWVWLVLGSDGKLKVTRSPNGSNPLATGEGKVLLGCDVWEHSYYLDFRNRRPDYLQNWVDKLANYEYAEAQLKAA